MYCKWGKAGHLLVARVSKLGYSLVTPRDKMIGDRGVYFYVSETVVARKFVPRVSDGTTCDCFQ